jgi:hypothetical protein
MASTTAQVSITNGSTGTGTTIDFTTAKKTVTAVIVGTGTIQDGQVLIEASQDSTNWVPIQQVAVDQGRNRGVSLNGQAYRYWRASVPKDVAGGGRITVTFMEAD